VRWLSLGWCVELVSLMEGKMGLCRRCLLLGLGWFGAVCDSSLHIGGCSSCFTDHSLLSSIVVYLLMTVVHLT
jgi:hypothetical protein